MAAMCNAFHLRGRHNKPGAQLTKYLNVYRMVVTSPIAGLS